MKIEVDFPANFETDEAVAMQLGRVYLGPHVARLVFCPDGKVRMLVNQKALDDGWIKTYSYDDQSLFGLKE